MFTPLMWIIITKTAETGFYDTYLQIKASDF